MWGEGLPMEAFSTKASSFLRGFEEAKKGWISPGALGASHSISLGPTMGGYTTHIILFLALVSFWAPPKICRAALTGAVAAQLSAEQSRECRAGSGQCAGTPGSTATSRNTTRSHCYHFCLFLLISVCLFVWCLLSVQMMPARQVLIQPSPLFIIVHLIDAFLFLFVWLFGILLVFVVFCKALQFRDFYIDDPCFLFFCQVHILPLKMIWQRVMQGRVAA